MNNLEKSDEMDLIIEPANTDVYSLFVKRLAAKNWYTFWGPVTDVSCEQCSLFIMDAMLRNVKEITLIICSGGGSEDDARALLGIMELAKQSGMVIRCYGAGCVASAAFDIFTACTPGYRFAFEVTMFMTHSSAGHVSDSDMYDLQKRYDMWTLKNYTSIHPTTRRRFMKTGNWWFDPDKAVEYGVADAVIKRGEELPKGPIFPVRKSDEQQQHEAAEELSGE